MLVCTYVGPGYLDAGSHACTASTFSAEPHEFFSIVLIILLNLCYVIRIGRILRSFIIVLFPGNTQGSDVREL